MGRIGNDNNEGEDGGLTSFGHKISDDRHNGKLGRFLFFFFFFFLVRGRLHYNFLYSGICI